MPLTHGVYLGLVLGFGLLLVLIVTRWLDAVRLARRRRVEARRRFEPIPTESPVEDPAGEARQRAVESIEAQFSISRRVVLPILAVTILLLLSIPFLHEFPAALLSLLIGGGTVLIGLAARPFVENALSGLALSSSRLVSLGDTVIVDGWYGRIEDVTLTHTIVKIWDWRRYVVPNVRMLQNPFINASLFDPFQWAYVEFWVAYDSDIGKVRRLAVEAAKSSRAFGGYEEPAFWVLELAPAGIKCWIAAWADTPAKAWQLTHDTRTTLVESLRREGIATHTHRYAEAPTAADPERS